MFGLSESTWPLEVVAHDHSHGFNLALGYSACSYGKDSGSATSPKLFPTWKSLEWKAVG